MLKSASLKMPTALEMSVCQQICIHTKGEKEDYGVIFDSVKLTSFRLFSEKNTVANLKYLSACNRYRLLRTHQKVNICTFAAIDSKSIAIVILEGNAWGLMIRSGLMPVFAENGMSMSGHSWEQTPFCPCLLLNLSPIIGFLTRRRRMFACRKIKWKIRQGCSVELQLMNGQLL